MQFECPQCGADAYVLLKMSHRHSYRLKKFFELVDHDQQRSKEYQEIKQPSYCKPQEASTNNRFTPHLQDNRNKLTKLYNNGNEKIRHIIQKSIKYMKVSGNDGDFLRAQISDDGLIEIINAKTGRIILWSYLTDSERWSFWQQFNKLLDKVKK
jgi:hypothetical protein